MKLSTANLTLAADAAIDLQLHTVYSDGDWQPEALIGHLMQEGFGLAAITDHDRVDTLTTLQQLALEKGFPLLAAVEMSTVWRSEPVDVLCYGIAPEHNHLADLCEDLLRRQRANTREVYDNLITQGCNLPTDELEAILAMPSARHPHELVALVGRHGYGTAEKSAGKMVMDAGCQFAMTDIAVVVDAVHRSGGVCLIAHPGRGDGYPVFDADLFDQLRQEAPVDGFELYYPKHSADQITAYRAYAEKYNLLISAGSDSHRPDKPPIKYPAMHSRTLLERLGISIE